MNEKKSQKVTISGEKVVNAGKLFIRGDLNLGEKPPINVVPLSFARLRLDSPYWETTNSPRSGWKSLYPFDFECTQYFYLRSHLERQDPALDVLIKNNTDKVEIILAVGLLIVETADVTLLYGGGVPARSFRITKEDVFNLEMPEIKSLLPRMSESYPPKKDDIEIVKRNELVRLEFDDPVGIEPGQPYRFGLGLSEFIDNMPNNVTARLVIETHAERQESDLVYFFTF